MGGSLGGVSTGASGSKARAGAAARSGRVRSASLLATLAAGTLLVTSALAWTCVQGMEELPTDGRHGARAAFIAMMVGPLVVLSSVAALTLRRTRDLVRVGITAFAVTLPVSVGLFVLQSALEQPLIGH